MSGTDATSCTMTVGIVLAVVATVMLGFLIPSDEQFQKSDLNQLASNLTIIVTGANSGLGCGTVEHLAKAGTSRVVVLACRTNAKCEDARRRASLLLPPNSQTRLLTASLDLSNKPSIEAFAQNLPMILSSAYNETHQKSNDDTKTSITREPTIDVLINNAGIFARSVHHEYMYGIEEHMFVNYLGHVLLTHLLWPTLQRSNARIVSVSSISTLIPSNPMVGWYPFQRQWSDVFSISSGLFRYLRSKRANLIFARELHRRFALEGTVNGPLTVSSVASHPGYTRSEIWSNGAKILPSFWAKLIEYNPIMSMSSFEGALTQLWAALDRQHVPSGSYVGPRWWLFGKPIGLGPIDKPTFPFHHSAFSNEEALWDKTMEVLEIEEFGRPREVAARIEPTKVAT